MKLQTPWRQWGQSHRSPTSDNQSGEDEKAQDKSATHEYHYRSHYRSEVRVEIECTNPPLPIRDTHQLRECAHHLLY